MKRQSKTQNQALSGWWAGTGQGNLVTGARRQSSRWRDRLAAGLCWTVAAVLLATFGWILADLLSEGLGRLSWDFFTKAPMDAGRAGGIGTVLVSTLLILAVCLLVAAPLGIATAAYLSEYTRRKSSVGRWIRGCLDLLASVPSIVFGLFGAVFFCQMLGLGFSILSGGLTLACMVLPILVRSSETGFRMVSDDLRRGAAALGMRQNTTMAFVILPAALPGIAVGLVLGIGRALAETAALIFTSGYVTRMPASLLDSGRSLSIHIYDLAMNVPGGEPTASGTALVLVVLLAAINWGAAAAMDRWRGRWSRS